MRPRNIDMDLDDVDANGVFQDQTLGGSGNFTLNGAGVTDGEWITPDGFAKQIGFESSGNISARTFTVTGYGDFSRNVQVVETLSGPNNNTVETSNYFAIITSIASDGAVGTNTEAGPVDEAVSPTVPMNWRGGSAGVGITVTGTIDYTLQQTFDDIQSADSYPLNWGDCPTSDLVNATASQTIAYSPAPRALRVKVNSYSSGARLEIGVTQADV